MADFLNSYVTGPVKQLGSILTRSASSAADKKTVETIVKHEYMKPIPISYTQLPFASRGFLKLAALSGAAAVAMSAYGSHCKSHLIDHNLLEFFL